MRNWFGRRADINAAPSDMAVAQVAPPSRREEILHVFALVNFAIAQPLYDRLMERQAFLIDLQLRLPELCVLAFVLSLGIPAGIVLLEELVRRCYKRAFPFVQQAVFGTLLLFVAMPVVKLATFLSGYQVCLVGLGLAALGMWAYSRHLLPRQLVTLTALGIVVFPVVFLSHVTSRMSVSSPRAIRAEKFQPVPVVLLVLDEFCGSSLMTPQRQIDARRFPNFASLAGSSTWFRNATSVHDMTERALPAILSGRYLARTDFQTAADLPQNVFTVLKRTGGYELAAFEPVSRLATLRDRSFPGGTSGAWKRAGFLMQTLTRVYLFHVTPTDLCRYLPAIPVSWFGLSDGGAVDQSARRGVFRYEWNHHRTQQFQHFIECIDDSAHPTLYFQHVLFPHVPWSYLPTGRRYASDGADWNMLNLTTHGPHGDSWGQDELEAIQSQQRYLLQLMGIDRMIGQLVERLKRTGQYDRCLLIVTADHGVSFRSNQSRRAPVTGNEDEILSIPLFVKRPHQVAGEVSDRAVESVDILPTIADVVGITLEAEPDGWSVFDTSHPERQQKSYFSIRETHHATPESIINSRVPHELRTRFGDSADPVAMFRIGPFPELIGRKVDSLELSQAAPVELELSRYGDELTDDGEIQVPCWYEGTVRSQLPLADSPIVLAVAINGTIQAMTRTYQQVGFLDQWSAMVPESAFHKGRNDVQFFRVIGTGADQRFSACVVHRPSK